jgi:hypothetical protein
MCLAVSLTLWRAEIDCWTSRNILWEKILNFLVSLEFRILVEKSNVNEGHIFPRSLLQTCRLETTSLCLNTRLLVNKKIQILNIFLKLM